MYCRNELDVSNFSDEFTQMPATDSPAIVPPNYDKLFKGYSYVAPSVLFTSNVISDDLLKPLIKEEDTSMIETEESLFFKEYTIDPKEKILGDGSFSICRRCVHKSTKKEYAVKIVSKKFNCTQEINMLRACQGHKNIVKLHDVVTDERFTYLIFEFLKGGELLDRIRNKSRFTESEAADILRKLVSAVSFIHDRGVVHRDLKPENLLFTSHDPDAEIKVVDFGFARLKQEKEVLRTPCFTLPYAAPEVLNGESEGYDENCDLWSLGVILYAMLCGKAPFHARSRDDSAVDVMNRIKGGDFTFSAPSWSSVSDEAKAIVRGLLTVDPSQRLGMVDLQRSSWVQGSQSFPHTPLMTPGVLSSSGSAERNLQTTYDAFHKAQREGFRLQDVVTAKLAQRRRKKKNSSDNNSSSSFSSESSLRSGPSTPIARPKLSIESKKTDEKSENCSEKSSLFKVSSSSSDNKDTVFNFGETRVTEYLRTMSASPLDPNNLSPSVSTSARTSDSSVVTKENQELEVKRTELERDSTASSGIVVSEGASTDSKEKSRSRKRKVYTRSRQSERLRMRRLQRQEIDYDPEPFMVIPNIRKRKIISTVQNEDDFSPMAKVRRKSSDKIQVRVPRKALRSRVR